MQRFAAVTRSARAATIAAASFTSLPELTKPAGAPATLPKLPYPVEDGIKPVISPHQFDLHYNKHHKAYVDKLNSISKPQYEGKTIAEIVAASSSVPDEKVLFNQAAQHFNHSFFWKSLKPGGSPITEDVKSAIADSFGSFEAFQTQFADAATGNFGSGWTWLNYDTTTKKLVIENTSNAGSPVIEATKVPLLTIDVWEHAYYVDFENRRPEFIKGFWQIVDWSHVAQQLAAAKKA